MRPRNLLSRLLDYLNGPEPTEHQRSRTETIKRPEAEISSPEQFGERVGRIFAEQHPVAGGKIQVLNLRPLHERYKDRWSRLADLIHRHVANILKRRLSPQDAFTRNADDTYLIVFANLSEDEARLKCAVLAHEIMDKLQGADSEATNVSIQTRVTTLSGDVGLEAAEAVEQVNLALGEQTPPSIQMADLPGRQTRDPLTELFSSIEKELHALDASAISRNPAAVQIDMHRLCELLYRAEDELAAIARDPVAPVAASPDWTSVLRGKAKTMLNAVDQIRTAIEAQTGVPAIPSSSDKAVLDFLYKPIWQARRGVVTTYRCELKIEMGGSELLHDDPMPEEDGVVIANAMDCLVLRRAVRDLATGVEERRPTVVIIPVHYLTIARPTMSSTYLRTLHTIPEKLRSFIVWEVLDAPTGTWNAQIFPVLSILKRFGRAVILRVSISSSALKELSAIGVHAAGLDLRSYDDSDRSLNEKIERFASLAEKAGMQCFLYGVASLAMANSAIAAGFDYIAGDVIAAQVKFPAGVVPTDLYHVYERNLGKP